MHERTRAADALSKLLEPVSIKFAIALFGTVNHGEALLQGFTMVNGFPTMPHRADSKSRSKLAKTRRKASKFLISDFEITGHFFTQTIKALQIGK
jgi:hypothetical protein